MSSLQTLDNIRISYDPDDFLVKDVECRCLDPDKGEVELKLLWNNRIDGVLVYVIQDGILIEPETLTGLDYCAEFVQSQYQRTGRCSFTISEVGLVSILVLPWYREGKSKRVALQVDKDNCLFEVIGRQAKISWKTEEKSGLLAKLKDNCRRVRIIIETTDPIPAKVLTFTYSGGSYEIDAEIDHQWDRTIIEPRKSDVAVRFSANCAGKYPKIFQLVREGR